MKKTSNDLEYSEFPLKRDVCSKKQESHVIAGTTARYRSQFRYEWKFSVACAVSTAIARLFMEVVIRTYYPLLSQERVKLRTSNLAGTFTGSIRTKAH